MLELLILLTFNSLLCFGFWNACHDKGVLWFVDKWFKDTWIYKPVCYCLPCMASLHSIYPYWTYMYSVDCININAVLFYPVYVLSLSGLNYLIDRE